MGAVDAALSAAADLFEDAIARDEVLWRLGVAVGERALYQFGNRVGIGCEVLAYNGQAVNGLFVGRFRCRDVCLRMQRVPEFGQQPFRTRTRLHVFFKRPRAAMLQVG